MSQNQQEQSEAKLLAYLEGELDPAGVAEIEKHLEAHPQHRKLLDEMKGMRDWVRWLPRELAPPDLVEEFQGQLERAALLGGADDEDEQAESRLRIHRAGRVNRWPQIRAAAAVAGLAVGLGAAVYFSLPPRNGSATRVPSVQTKNELALGEDGAQPTTESALPEGASESGGVGGAGGGAAGAPEPGPLTRSEKGPADVSSLRDDKRDSDTAKRLTGAAKPAAGREGPEVVESVGRARGTRGTNDESPRPNNALALNASTAGENTPREQIAKSGVIDRATNGLDSPAAAGGAAGASPNAAAPATPPAPGAPANAAATLAPPAPPAQPAAHPAAPRAPGLADAARSFSDLAADDANEKMKEAAQRYAATNSTSYNSKATAAGPRLEPVAPGRRAPDRGLDRFSKSASAESRRSGPLVMVVLAPDPAQARKQISDYLASRNLSAPVADASEGLGAGKGLDFRRSAVGGTGAPAPAPGAAPTAAPAAPAPAPAAPAGSAAAPRPSGPGALAKSNVQADGTAGQGGGAGAKVAGRPGEPAAREVARTNEERKTDAHVEPRVARRPAAPPPARAAAPFPARPGTSGTFGVPAGAPATPAPGSATAGARGGAGGVNGVNAAPGTPATGTTPGTPPGAAQPKPEVANASGRDQLPTPTLPSGQLPATTLDKSAPGAPGGTEGAAAGATRQRSFNFPASSPLLARMTARQVGDLQAALSRPTASQWAAVYDEVEDAEHGEAAREGSDKKQAPELRSADASKDNREITGGRAAKGGDPNSAALHANLSPAAGPAATQPAGQTGPAGGVARSPASGQQQRPGEEAAAPRSAAASAAQGTPAVQQQARVESQQDGAATNATAQASDDDQPVDVVILLEQSPQAAQTTQTFAAPTTPAAPAAPTAPAAAPATAPAAGPGQSPVQPRGREAK